MYYFPDIQIIRNQYWGEIKIATIFQNNFPFPFTGEHSSVIYTSAYFGRMQETTTTVVGILQSRICSVICLVLKFAHHSLTAHWQHSTEGLNRLCCMAFRNSNLATTLAPKEISAALLTSLCGWYPLPNLRSSRVPGGALGHFLGGYVPPGTPNWHPVVEKISPKIDTPF